MPTPRLLNRQRILLDLADLSEDALSLRRLTLLAFIIAHETRERGGDSFYAFVPHRKGPVSFTLYHEVTKLAENELIRFVDEQRISGLPGRVPSGLASRPDGDVRRAVCQFAKVSTDALASLIAKRYPTYKPKPKRESRKHPTVLYTKGYEAQPVERFLGDLLRVGVQTIVDVRRTPLSRRFGFHKTTLGRLAGEVDLTYYHFPSVGIPSSERKNVTSDEDYSALLDWYEAAVLPREREAVKEIAGLTGRTTSVLVCAEKEAELCHRSKLAKAVSSLNGLDVVHI